MTSTTARARLLGSRTAAPVSEEDRERLLKVQMEYELDRLGQTTSALESSSTTISAIFAANQDFRSRLVNAGKALGLLKQRVERDQRFVLLAFWFMVAMALFVVSRRIGLLWLLRSSISLLSKVTGLFNNAAESTKQDEL